MGVVGLGGGTVVVGAAAGPGVSVIFDPGGRRFGAGAAGAVAEAAASAVAVAAGLGGEAAGWRGFRFDVWVGMRNALAAGWGGRGRTQAQEMFWIKLWNHTVLRIVTMCVSKCKSRHLSLTLP